jgi:hypothetical protein
MMKSMRMILEGHVALMGEEFKLGFDKKTWSEEPIGEGIRRRKNNTEVNVGCGLDSFISG